VSRHACQRAAERYGISADAGDVRELLADIQHGRAVLLARLPDGKSYWLGKLVGVPVRAVVVATGDAIATVMPLRRLTRTIEARHREHRGLVNSKPARGRQPRTMEDME
jgi:hypothetical protein